jgi:peptidoglycan/xylan/chitin deacetylase (PgdA/CDA1 family)
VQINAIDPSMPSAPVPVSVQAAPPAGRRERLARRAYGLGVLPLLQSARRMLRHDLRVLAYHRVRDIATGFTFDPMLVSASPDGFASQVRWLRDRFRPVRCEEVIEALDGGRALPRDAVLVTFDDGYDDNYHVAFPVLRELGVPATFFVATGHIDSGAPFAYDWLVHALRTTQATRLQVPALDLDEPVPADDDARTRLAETLLDRLKSLDDAGQDAVMTDLQRVWRVPRADRHADCRPMDWNQLRDMRRAGMTIGAHGVHHRMLAKLPHAEMVAEIRQCKSRLDAELGEDVQALSYPVGGPDAYNDDVVAAARDAGFAIGFSYISGTNPLGSMDRFGLRRLSVEHSMDPAWFASMTVLPELFGYPTAFRVYAE